MGKAKTTAIAAAVVAALTGADHGVNNTYDFNLVKVIDSDTYRGIIQLWPGNVQIIDIRVTGIDTPERYRPSPKCRDHERGLAAKATKLAETALTNARRVYVTGVGLGKYAGRSLASVVLVDDRDRETSIARILMSSGLAYEYHGKTKPPDYWCGVKNSGE